MLSTAIIIFREVLEAGLVVGIIYAASSGVAGHGRWILGGITTGLIGAAIVALFAGQIANAVEGIGQELFNASVLLIATAMLGWHNVWMERHGREIAQNVKRVGDAVRAGHIPLYALAGVVAVAVLREGSEVVLFMYGLVAGGASTIRQYLATGLLDELHLHVSPVVLGEGERLLEGVGSDVRLEQLRAVEAPGVAHLYYRVVR